MNALDTIVSYFEGVGQYFDANSHFVSLLKMSYSYGSRKMPFTGTLPLMSVYQTVYFIQSAQQILFYMDSWIRLAPNFYYFRTLLMIFWPRNFCLC